MIFNSWSYLVLLWIAAPLYYFLPKRPRIVMVTIVSIIFYSMWRWPFTLLMMVSAFTDFFAALQIEKTDNPKKRKWLLGASLFVNLGLLAFFKYSYFIDDNIRMLADWMSADYGGLRQAPFRIILPLGISFYTFQSLSYTVDVYRGTAKPTRDPIMFTAFVTFWPQLVAGPILRADEVIPELEKKPVFDWANIDDGVRRILTGLFKKLVIADNLSVLVDEAYGLNAQNLTALDVWTATVLFGFQIYFDFAGYSDIAIGSSRILGINFPENFNWPYLANSPREFWKRWHISLSSWIRDYLYLPLMGQTIRGSLHAVTEKTDRSQGGLEIDVAAKPTRNPTPALFGTWLIMGLWHGAGWNFALWGLYHAAYIYLYRRVAWFGRLAKERPLVSGILTFFVMMAGWIPFRAGSLGQALTLFSRILNPTLYRFSGHQLHIKSYLAAFLILVAHLVAAKVNAWAEKSPNSKVLRVGRFLATVLMTILVITYLQTLVQFIYFQF